MNDRHKLAQGLSHCRMLCQNGKPQEALQKIAPWLEKYPKEPALLHLAGVASRENGNANSAVLFFSEALTILPNNAELNNSLANTLCQLQRWEQAERHYALAMKADPNYLDAPRNLALLYIDGKRSQKAIDLLEGVLLRFPQDEGLLLVLGNAYRKAERHSEAITIYQKVLALNPNHHKAIRNIGICFKLNEQANTAVEWLQRAQKMAPNDATVSHELGNAFFELGQFDMALKCYKDSVQKNPSDPVGHNTLNELLWQLGQKTKFLGSYDEAISNNPHEFPLYISRIKQLLHAHRLDEAEERISESRQIFGEVALLLRAEALLHKLADRYDSAVACLSRSVEKHPDPDAFIELAEANICCGDYYAASKALNKAHKSSPNNQLLWAYRSLCWRLSGDDRYEWLINYDEHVSAAMLPVPSGYDDLPHFMQELSSTLKKMHRTVHEPLAQSLRTGTQTPGRLLHKRNPVIQALKSSLEIVVAEYLSRFTVEPDHPFTSRNTGTFKFSGSWSVQLQSNGYHVNHVHPEGWISSSFYVDVPESVSAQSHEGCIKFGESGLDLGEREVVEKIVEPREGQLVLFPSYTWHGTFPFTTSDPEVVRTTAPFDVVPT